MNNTTIINIFNSDNSNFAYIKTQSCQIMATIAFKKSSLAKHSFFISITFSTINTFIYISSIVIQQL